jgi:hypothetical protein
MSKLVDKERLAQLAKALDERMKAAVKAEKERAEVAEARIEGKADANAQAIAAINNENTGLLKQAKDYADGQVAVEKQRAEGIEAGLAGRIETLEGKFTGEGSVTSQIEAAVNVEKQRALGQEAAIRSEFKAVDDTIKSDMATMKSDLQKEIDADVKVVADELAKQKDSSIAGTLANGVSQAFEGIQEQSARISTLNATQQNHASRIGIIEGEGSGSIKFAVKQEANRAKAEEERIAGLVGTEQERAEAKEAELLQAITKEVEDRVNAVKGLSDRHDQEMEAAAEQVAEDLAALKEELQGEIDEDVAAEALRADGKIKEEADRAKGEEARIEAAYKAADTALHTTISAEIDADVKAAVDAQKLVDDAQDESLEDHKGRIEALEAKFGEGSGTVEDQIAVVQREVDDLEVVVEGIDSVVDEHVVKLTGLKKETVQGAIDEAKNEALNKAMEYDVAMSERMASVEGQVADGGPIKTRIAKNETDIAGHQAKIAVFEGDANTAGSIAQAKAVADDAKAKIDAFMDANAVKDETINTLKEIQDYIAEHGTEAAGMVDDIAKNAADIAAEAVEARKQEGLIRQELADEAQEIRDEVEAALGKWEVIEEGGAVSQERSGLRGEIDDKFDQLAGELGPMLEGIIAGYQEADEALEGRVNAKIAADVKVVADALAHEKDVNAEGTLGKLIADEIVRAINEENDIRQHFTDLNKTRIEEEVRIEGLITDEVARAKKAEGDLDAKIAKAVEDCEEMDRIRQAAIDGLERFEEETTALLGNKSGLDVFGNPKEATGLCKDVEDNTKAIEQEVADRQTAITNALKAYSTTEDMKQVIGNVVNSLALTMENDKVVLKLGGKDGIALTEVSLDLASDADIDAIIAGLDAPAE